MTSPLPLKAPSNAKVIGRNFIFMGLEVLIAFVSTLLTTVVIARVIGPTRLGYFNLVFWLTAITSSVGSLGIPLATFKYMGEFLGSGQKELARSVFFYNLRAQSIVASALTAIGMVAVFTMVDPEYRVCSALLVLSIVPNMITYVASQANTAAEDSALNTRGALVGAIVYVVAVAISLLLGWNLIGIRRIAISHRRVGCKDLACAQVNEIRAPGPTSHGNSQANVFFFRSKQRADDFADRHLGPLRHHFLEIAAA